MAIVSWGLFQIITTEPSLCNVKTKQEFQWSKWQATMKTQEKNEILIVIKREHSIFWIACQWHTISFHQTALWLKINLVIWNTLFKSAKFYPQPSHADLVVGLCLYDCNFQEFMVISTEQYIGTMYNLKSFFKLEY